MGIDIVTKNQKAHYKSSYSSFKYLRSVISKSHIDPNDYDDLKLLLNHSDCDGVLTPHECKRVLDALRKLTVDFDNDPMHEKLYNDLINVLSYAAKHRVNIYFS